ncbi:hypothetical protein EIP91_011826 [Steccherinum ochraceum]|uniref:glutathione transferase n=1 Tax=Steccherinum ochraceum TaxID=92696 RepID=A0A4R0RL65_9APHY|nr:hypothetical protein EIP91_011826 [Steccherinum ochraceum]
MVLKLHGFAVSTCTLRVATVLKELNVPFEFVPVDITKGEQKVPQHVKIQPFGQIPYIEDDDGFILYESRAICRYIAAKYRSNVSGPALLPDLSTEMEKYAKFEQAASVEAWNFDFYASNATLELIFKSIYGGGVTDEVRAKEYLESLEKNLDVYDKILSSHRYLAGDDITLADIFHIPYARHLHTRKYINLEDANRPNLTRWWKDITSRPSWQSVQGGVTSFP